MHSPAGQGEITLVLDSVTMNVVPQNGKAFGLAGPIIPVIPIWYSEAKTEFWVLISFLSNTGEITFDPRVVTLETEGGDTFRAAGFNGPIPVSKISLDNSTAVNEVLDGKTLNRAVTPFPISADVLVGVMFATKTIGPDQDFTLVLDGLEKEGHRIDMPTLKFSKERRRHFTFSFLNFNFPKEWAVSE